MPEDKLSDLIESVRDHFNPPPEPPREEMWRAIEARLGAGSIDAGEGTQVVDLASERRRRSWAPRRPVSWAVAAAALLVLGIGIGRMTARGPSVPPVAEATESNGSAIAFATAEHFGRSESLLRMVQTEARNGRLAPNTAAWAKGLLSQTRLLIDAGQGGDAAMTDLLEDLELVLVQIVGVTEGSLDEGQTRTELLLALRGLDDRDVLPRIEASVPGGFSGQ